MSKLSLIDFCEIPADNQIPWLDRCSVLGADYLSDNQRKWQKSGFLIVDHAVDEEKLQAYEYWRLLRNLPDAYGCLPNPFAYQFISEVRNIALSPTVHKVMYELFQEPMVAHFDLTQWKSTERKWHQDDYLNDESINGHYAAVWFAIDNIAADSGPFQYIEGSNNWPVMRREKIMAKMKKEDANSPSWPVLSEQFVGELFDEKIKENNIPVESFLPLRGQALIWHARLVHRGSLPKNSLCSRKSLIVHFTALSKTNPKLHDIRYSEDGCAYIWHKNIKFEDWPEETGIKRFIPLHY